MRRDVTVLAICRPVHGKAAVAMVRHGVVALLGAALATGLLSAGAASAGESDLPMQPSGAAAADPQSWNWQVLTAPTLTDPADYRSAKPVRAAALPPPPDPTFSKRAINPDGSSAVTVGRKLPTEWDSRVGMDVSVAAPPTPRYSVDAALGQAPPAPSSAAWANVTVPGPDTPLAWDKASVDARVDPFADQAKLGASLSRSVPLGDRLAVTVQNGYAVTQSIATAAPATPTPEQTWSTDRAVKLRILPSDTTLAAASTMSSTDDKWLRSVSAEQKLFGGPVSVTGSVSETTTGELNKTITAGFRHTW